MSQIDQDITVKNTKSIQLNMHFNNSMGLTDTRAVLMPDGDTVRIKFINSPADAVQPIDLNNEMRWIQVK